MPIKFWKDLPHLKNMDFNKMRMAHGFILRCDLSGSDMRGMDAQQGDIKLCKLHGADLSDSFFYKAALNDNDFTGATMCNIKLEYGYMYDSILVGANLEGASLTFSNLSRSDFSGANLRGVDFTGAALDGVNFTGADLTGAIFSKCIASTCIKTITCPSVDLESLR